MDVGLDPFGGEFRECSSNMLKPGGRYITSLLAETPQEEPQRRGIQSMGWAAWPKSDVLTQVAKRIDPGKSQLVVNRTHPLDQANEAI